MIRQLYDAGCRTIQFDDCTWGAIVGDAADLKINFTSGPYDSVADYVFARENVKELYLEYDDERSGGFAPLAKVSDDKSVVLGLITSKSPKLEDKATVIARIKDAAQYIPLDRLKLSPQCGFDSCEVGNKLTDEEQWAKIALIKEIAEEVWGK